MFIFCIYFLRSVRVPSPNAFFLLFDTLNIKKRRLFDGFFPLKPFSTPKNLLFHLKKQFSTNLTTKKRNGVEVLKEGAGKVRRKLDRPGIELDPQKLLKYLLIYFPLRHETVEQNRFHCSVTPSALIL